MVYQLKRLQTNERPQAFWGSLIPSAISFIGGLITSSQQAKAQRRALEEQQRLAQQQLNISNQNQLASSLNNYANAQQSYDDKDYNLKYRIGGVKRLGGRNIMITDGGNAKRIGNNTYLLRGGSHEDINETGQTGIGINVGGNEIEAEGGEVAQRKGNSLRIYSAQPILGGMSPAQAIMRGYNKDKVFNAQQRFKKNNGIKDDGSKAQWGDFFPLFGDRKPVKSTGRYSRQGDFIYDNKTKKRTISQLPLGLTYPEYVLLSGGRQMEFNRLKEAFQPIRKAITRKGFNLSKEYPDLKSGVIEYLKQFNGLINPIMRYGGLTSKDRGSSKHPYPSVASKDFAGGNRSYPIPTKADAIDALRLAGLHGRSDVRSKVYSKYPELRKKARGGTKVDPYYDWARNTSSNLRISFIDPTYDYRVYYNSVTPYERNLIRFAPQGTHFTDIGKTPKHPTFSNESKYSNKKTPGGTWNGNVFVPAIWQFGNNGNKIRNKYMNNSGEGYFNGRINIFPTSRQKHSLGGRPKAEDGTSMSLASSYNNNKDFLHRLTQGHPTARKIVNEIFGDEADRRRFMQDLNIFGLTSDDASSIAGASPIFRRPIVSAARQAQFIQDANKARQAANANKARQAANANKARQAANANKARQAANYAQQQIDYVKELNDRISATMRNVGEQLGIRVNPNPNNSVRRLYSSNFKPTKTNNRITTPRETPINSTTSSATNTPTYSGKTTKFNTKYRSYRNAGFSPRTSKDLVKANKLGLYSTIGGFGTIGAGTLIGANINKTDKTNKAQLDAKGKPISPYIARPQEPVKTQTKKVTKVVKRQVRTTPQYTGNTTRGNYQLHDGETKTINGIKYTRRGNTIINHKTNVGYIYDKNGNYTGQADYSKVGNFNQAFDAARAAGRSQFIYRAGKYNNYSTNKETNAKKEALNRRIGARRIAKRFGGIEHARRRAALGTQSRYGFTGDGQFYYDKNRASYVDNPYYEMSGTIPEVVVTAPKKTSIDLSTTPYLGRQNTFKPATQDYIGLGIDTLAALGSGLFTRSAYNKMNFDYALPNYVDESPVAFDTIYHNEAQRANVERNRLNSRDLIRGNTSSAQTALGRMQQTDTDAMMELNKLVDEKANKEVELRNQNLANEQQVRARNAAARNQYYQNVAQIRNAALEAKNNMELAKAQSIGTDLSGLSQAWTNFASSVENRYDARQNEIAAISSANSPSVVKNAISLGYNLSPEVLANLYKNSKNDELRNVILGRLSANERKRYGIK